MRIVGGKYKGRKIAVNKSFHSRPTTDFAKEGLFNILANHFDFREVHFLDLFSGTGNISFEISSRGCTRADLVDIDRKSVQHISGLIREYDLEGIRAVCMDALEFVRFCRSRYHLAFADPPYGYKQLKDLPEYILKSNILYPGGWFILEHSGRNVFADHPMCFDERQYGNVGFSFFQKK